MLDYEVLRIIWWGLLGVLLIGFAVMDGFDLGVAALLPIVARTDLERRVVINTVGPVWEGNQVWFILGGGAIFAAWPMIYSVSFSGFYVAMFITLAAFILRPVAFKFRSKMPHSLWRSVWDYTICGSGFVPALIFGVAVGNVLQGVPFHFDPTLRMTYTGTFWQLLNPFALLCGLLSVAMLLMHGGFYLAVKTQDAVQRKAAAIAAGLGIVVIILFAAGGYVISHVIKGFELAQPVAHDQLSNPLHKQVLITTGGWLINYSRYPFFIAAPALGFIGAFLAVWMGLIRAYKAAFVCSAVSIAGIIATVGLSMFPFLLPSSSNFTSSLLVWDASSSQNTLFIMLIATIIFLPIILLYTAWVYRVMRGAVTAQEVLEHQESYY